MEEQKVSSVIALDNEKDNFENDGTDIFTKDLFKLGLDDFFDAHPIGALPDQPVEGQLSLDFKSDPDWWARSTAEWSVDLIKLYFIGIKGQQIVLVCHTGETWVKADNNWKSFSCELHRPENPGISVEKIGMSVCDETNAGSSSDRIQLKFCRNAKDFSSAFLFKKAVAAGRCCKTNY